MFIKPSYKSPIILNATVSIPAGGTGTAKIDIPAKERYYVKKVTITKGANVTVDANGVLFDGEITKQTASFDSVDVFGDVLASWSSIRVDGSNAGTTAEDLTVEVTGYKLPN